MLTKLSLMIQKIVSKEASRFTLNGIFITDKESVVTDSHRLTRVKHLSVQDMDRHVVLKAADAVSLSKMAGKEPIEVVVATDSQISFRVGANKTIFEPLEGRFPEYLRIIPSKTDDHICIVFNPKMMKDLMEIHGAADDCVRMYVHLLNPNSNAIILESARVDGQDVQSLLMPIREAEGYKARRYSV
jgi:DNA polymerase III sliding clamp (beta) subunit (PCNA family)